MLAVWPTGISRGFWSIAGFKRVQKLCKSRGGRPGLSVLMSLTVSVDVKQHWTMLRHWSHFVPNMSTDIWGHEALLHPIVGYRWGLIVSLQSRLQALVFDILPSTTAVFIDAIGSRKLSANEQFVVRAQTAVSLIQTTQLKRGVSFIAANKVYTSTNKTTIVSVETELLLFSFFLLPGVDVSHVYVGA